MAFLGAAVISCGEITSPSADAGASGGGEPGGQCPTDLVACGGECINTQTNPQHCGACDSPCEGTCSEGVCIAAKTVFVTSQTYSGNMGGLDGADANCQERARAGNLSGTYRAWLSDSTGSPVTRMSQSGGPYLMANGTMVASDWNDFLDGQLFSAINLDELGNASVDTLICQGGEVWTNTGVGGLVAGEGCNNWSVDQGSTALAGNANFADAMWTSACPRVTCVSKLPIYCIEQ